MISTTLLMATILVGQSTTTPRVACTSSGSIVAQVWIATSGSGATSLMYQQNGMNASTTVPMPPGASGPVSPDVDVDDAGNFAIVWCTTQGVGGTWMLYNSLAAGNIQQVCTDSTGITYSGTVRVTIGRAGSNITVALAVGADNGQLAGRGRGATTIMAQTYVVQDAAVRPTAPLFLVAGRGNYTGNYTFGNVSSGDNGDPVIVYSRPGAVYNPTTNSYLPAGDFAKGYKFPAGGSGTPSLKFDEVQFGGVAGGGYTSYYYSNIDVDCYHNGSFLAAYDDVDTYGDAGRYKGVRHYDSSGNLIAYVGFPVNLYQGQPSYLAVACRRNQPGTGFFIENNSGGYLSAQTIYSDSYGQLITSPYYAAYGYGATAAASDDLGHGVFDFIISNGVGSFAFAY